MTSIIFPGQGSQYVGMSKDFYENFDIARRTFQEIEEYVNLDLKKIIFSDENDLINTTKYTQISIFTASVSIFKTYQNEMQLDPSSINVMLGHSLGEYTALACSNKLNLKECSLILKKRGELMNDAVPPNKSGMVALIGKSSEEVEEIIKINKINLEIANDNSPIQVVLSGEIDEIKKNKDLFISNGIKKYIILNVSAAFHSNHMKNAQDILSEEIKKLNFNNNSINIISNYSADISNDGEIIKSSLKSQMANKVEWTKSVKKLEETGIQSIIEIGPGKVLSGLIKRISDNFDIKSINTISDIS